MFLRYYNLTSQPFGVTPDPRYLHLSPTHREAMASVFSGVMQNRGFTALIAHPGMGKTTLLFDLLQRIPRSLKTVFLFQTQCSERDLIRSILADLGVHNAGDDLAGMQGKLKGALLREASQGRRVIVLVDEAHNLDDSVLEGLRVLSNFETGQDKLLHIVLAGQPELARKLYRGAQSVAGDTEASVYAALGLTYIEPELREASGEIEAAARHDLPKLVRLADVKGDLHAHTSASDGMNSLEEMARAARQRGLDYLAITDHSRRLTVAHGLDAERLRQQGEAIDRLNAQMRGFTLLKGIEVDILKDGTLDLPDEALKRLDLVVAAIHSDFALPRDQQTERILRALDNPYVAILAHPTGRLLLERDPYDVDMPRIMKAARARGCFLEINAHPDRLDLSDAHCRMAKNEGVKLSLGTDAHRVGDLGNLAYGVDCARRGWLEAGDIVNTRSIGELKALLRAARRAKAEDAK